MLSTTLSVQDFLAFGFVSACKGIKIISDFHCGPQQHLASRGNVHTQRCAPTLLSGTLPPFRHFTLDLACRFQKHSHLSGLSWFFFFLSEINCISMDKWLFQEKGARFHSPKAPCRPLGTKAPEKCLAGELPRVPALGKIGQGWIQSC